MPPEGTPDPITILDTVSWSIPECGADTCRKIMDTTLEAFPIGTEWSAFEKGTQGYKRQAKLVSGSLVLGWAQFGASHGKVWLYFTGAGLRARREGFRWYAVEVKPDDEAPSDDVAPVKKKKKTVQKLLLDQYGNKIPFKDVDLYWQISSLHGAKLTRIDIALDIFTHAMFSVKEAMDAYAVEKRFYETVAIPGRRASEGEKARYVAARHEIKAWKHLKSPVMPCTTNYESRRAGDDRVARTFYIGKLDGPKMVRVYDKGLQLIGKFSDDQFEAYRKDGVIKSKAVPDGAKLEEYTRVELVLRDKGKQELDAAILTDIDSYFAGGFPMLAKLLEVADGVRPAYIPREEDCVHARMIEAHRESYGGHIYFMSEVLGWSAEDIVRRLKGTKSSARLMVDSERADAD
jgi:hypothetical protein